MRYFQIGIGGEKKKKVKFGSRKKVEDFSPTEVLMR